MKEYAVTIRVECKIEAPNEEKAQERAQALADAYSPVFRNLAKAPNAQGEYPVIKTPTWVGDVDEQAVDNVEELE